MSRLRFLSSDAGVKLRRFGTWRHTTGAFGAVSRVELEKGLEMLDTTKPETMEGLDVVDPDGNKIGTVDEIYVDENSGVPEFALVKSGLFGISRHFVPIQDARADGDQLHVSYSKDQVSDAPALDPDGHLSESEGAQLYRYYGITAGTASPRGDDVVSAGRGTDGGTSDDAMTRS